MTLRSIFTPSKKLMDRLTYPQKLVLTAFIIALPLSTLLYHLISGINSTRVTVQKERGGLRYIRLTLGLLQDVQQHRGMTNAFLRGDRSFGPVLTEKQTRIEEDLRRIDEVNNELGVVLKTGDRWRSLIEKWHVVKRNALNLEAEDSFDIHTSLVNDILALIAHVSGTSTMITDPYPDSYYLIDTLVDKLPLASEYMGQTRGIGVGAIVPRELGPRERTNIIVLMGLIKLTLDKVEEDLSNAFQANAELKAALGASLQEMHIAVASLDRLNQQLITAKGARIDPLEYFTVMTKIMSTSYTLSEATGWTLDRVLLSREEVLRKRTYYLLLSALLLFLIVAYLYAGMYFSIVSALFHIVSTSRRVASGDLRVSIPVDTKDEMAVVAESFNEMTKNIADQTTQLKVINENLQKEIAERKGAEEELARVSRYYELILESAGEGIYGLDKQGRHTIVNHASVNMLGYPGEEIIGKKSHTVWHHTRADGTPYPEEECKIYKTIHDGIARHVDDEVFWKKDGTSFPVEYTVTPIFVESNIEGVVVTFSDIAERKRSEEHIRRLTHKYEMILNSAGEGIYGVALNDVVVFVNTAAAAMLGYAIEETIGKKSHSTWHHTRPDGSPYPEKECAIYKTFREGSINRISNEVFWKKDGTSFPVEYTTTPIYDDGRVVGAVITFRDITERKHAEEAADEAARNLSNYVDELEQRNREIELFAEMNSLLQACLNADEVSLIIARAIKQIFQNESGIVYLLTNEQGVLESIAVWGTIKAAEHVPSTRECWALRLGRTYLSGAGRSEMVCPHIVQQPDTEYLCVPMIAQSETVGLLYLQFNGRLSSYPEEARERRTHGKQRLAEAVAESIALSLANFKLRETLYTQSIHDPLTGLFNRRYMDELLEKELHRMLRKERALSVIMLDIDHFKLFNDSFGHEAGDILLRELGVFLQRQIRAEDFACRYGGEEFILIVPETPLESALQRAEQLRRSIKDLTIKYRGQTLGPITLSLGVAVFPKHGDNREALLRAADAALYRAKAEGRDRVVTVD